MCEKPIFGFSLKRYVPYSGPMTVKNVKLPRIHILLECGQCRKIFWFSIFSLICAIITCLFEWKAEKLDANKIEDEEVMKLSDIKKMGILYWLV